MSEAQSNKTALDRLVESFTRFVSAELVDDQALAASVRAEAHDMLDAALDQLANIYRGNR